MRIRTLRLENFQGIKHTEFDFGGQDVSIYGNNATGKTTVYNAVTWLLFDRPSTGAKSYTPKTKGPDGDLHYLDHAAEAQFIMDDGRLVTLRKVFHENYKKKRGSATKELDGHSVDFFIDGVPVKEKEYTSAPLGFCGGAEKMKMLTMPSYFAETMSWDERRKILLEVCGDVTDADVIASSGELAELPRYLLMPGTASQQYTVDEYKKIAAAQKSDINRQLQGIPGRIDEAQRAIPQEAADVSAIDARLAALHDERERFSNKKAAVLAGDTAASEARKRTAEAEAALAEARAAHLKKITEVNQDVQTALTDTAGRLNDAVCAQAKARGEAASIRMEIERITARREELMAEYGKVQAETWDEEQSICPTCRRPLPEDEIQRLREAFNQGKSVRLQRINEQGQREASKDMIGELQRQAAKAQEIADAAGVDYERLSKVRDNLREKLVPPVPFERTEEYASLSSMLAILQAEETGVGKAAANELEAVNAKLQAIYAEIQRLEQRKGQVEQAKAQERRIAELEAQEKALSAQYEELEKGIYLCDQFTKAKVRMLTDRINSKFTSVRFRLFLEQQNGGVRDDCEVLVPSESGSMVPYRDANNAARINAGLEIIEALSRHWRLSMPVFVDNAESVTSLIRTDMQTVRLVVSKNDRVLRLEMDTVPMEGAA